MNPYFSIYLEIARIIATLIVFLGHGKMFYQPLAEHLDVTNLGRDGIIIFFILSGFVITWCANERDKSVIDFAINRASRIYSVAIPGIILGIAASLFVSAYISEDISYQFDKPWIYLPIYLTFTGDLWNLSETPPGNFPYWSLNYEVWYYAIFAAFFYIRGFFRWPVVFCLMMLVGPGILSLFPLWIAGSLLYYLRNKIRLSTSIARVILAFTLGLIIIVKITAVDNTLDQYNAVLWGFLFNNEFEPPLLLGDYFIGLIVFINFVAAYNARLSFHIKADNLIKYLASFSFSFYLFHLPIFTAVQAIVPFNDSLLVCLFVMACSSVLIICLAMQTEHRKGSYRAFFRSLVISNPPIFRRDHK